ncbi:hypothetical protein M2401_006305 [Pseudomonas sp. JUb42]|nr:hypothetical protein [Pseudomonas sp. JUb42]
MTEITPIVAAPLLVDWADLAADLARIELALERWKTLYVKALNMVASTLQTKRSAVAFRQHIRCTASSCWASSASVFARRSN